MKHFDVPVEKLDVELQFICDTLNTVPFHGRVEGIGVGNSAKIAVNYVSLGTLFWIYDLKGERCCSFGAPEFLGIATAAVAPDGTFSMELPNFSVDPIVSDDGTAELKFWISGLKDHYFLCPQPTEGIETKAISIRIARSYPAEVTFRAVSLQDFR